MTREEAKEYLGETLKDFYDIDYDCDFIVDKIYDDFESRTCENCRNWSQEHITIGLCLMEVSEMDIPDLSKYSTSNNFGCNKFERKD